MYSVKNNFPSKYENTNMLCELCAGAESTQQHLFVCPVLKSFIPELDKTTTQYEYIFGNAKQMKEVVNILEKICDIRQQLLEDMKMK